MKIIEIFNVEFVIILLFVMFFIVLLLFILINPKWFKNKIKNTTTKIIHKHEWVEFGKSNAPIEDKAFTCKSCGRIGFPKYIEGKLVIEVWN